jgi:hypothetical protein
MIKMLEQRGPDVEGRDIREMDAWEITIDNVL